MVISSGFTCSIEQWETEISHRTKHLEVQVIFLEGRPPIRLWLIEKLQRCGQSFHSEALKQLPYGRWLSLMEEATTAFERALYPQMGMVEALGVPLGFKT